MAATSGLTVQSARWRHMTLKRVRPIDLNPSNANHELQKARQTCSCSHRAARATASIMSTRDSVDNAWGICTSIFCQFCLFNKLCGLERKYGDQRRRHGYKLDADELTAPRATARGILWGHDGKMFTQDVGLNHTCRFQITVHSLIFLTRNFTRQRILPRFFFSQEAILRLTAVSSQNI